MLLAVLLLLDGTIADLIRDLRSDDIGRRLAAVESLVALGEAGLEDVRTARAETDDDEMRARLGEIQARIEADVRRRAFPGGAEVRGLMAALAVRWDPVNRAAVFALEIMNVGERDCVIVEPKNWGVILPEGSRRTAWNPVLLEVRAVRITDDGADDTRYGPCWSSMNYWPSPVRLKPGDVRRSEHRLSRGRGARLLQLRSGDYEARAVYFSHRLLPGFLQDLETPWVAFTVPE